MNEHELIANWVAEEMVKQGMLELEQAPYFIQGFVEKLAYNPTAPTLQQAIGGGPPPALQTLNVPGKAQRTAMNAPAVAAQQAGQVTGIPMDAAARAATILQELKGQAPRTHRLTSGTGLGGVPGAERVAPVAQGGFQSSKIKLPAIPTAAPAESFAGAKAMLGMKRR